MCVISKQNEYVILLMDEDIIVAHDMMVVARQCLTRVVSVGCPLTTLLTVTCDRNHPKLC